MVDYDKHLQHWRRVNKLVIEREEGLDLRVPAKHYESFCQEYAWTGSYAMLTKKSKASS